MYQSTHSCKHERAVCLAEPDLAMLPVRPATAVEQPAQDEQLACPSFQVDLPLLQTGQAVFTQEHNQTVYQLLGFGDPPPLLTG
jgi:hypothetical protein